MDSIWPAMIWGTLFGIACIANDIKATLTRIADALDQL